MAVLFSYPFVQFFDDNGNPLAGGKIYTYQAGTTTPKATFTTSDASVQNTNPVVLDAAGRAVIFIQGSYRFDTFDANDVLIRSVDNVTSFATLESTNTAFFQSFSGTGSQTTFNLSETLGTESAALLVFVSRATESYVTNGSFATDTGWTKGSGWTIGAGVATATGAISTALSQTSPKTLVDGKAYRLTYTVTRSAGGIIPSIGGRAGTERTANGTYTEIIIASSTQLIEFTGNAFTGTIDNVVIENLDLLGFEIQDPSTYTVNGTILEFAVAPPIGTNNVYVFSPTQLVGAAAAAADQAQAAATAAEAAVATVINQKIVWQGDWVAGTYQINDAVQYEGASWIATAITTDTPSVASTQWDLLADKGANGSGGVPTYTSNQYGYLLRADNSGSAAWFGNSTSLTPSATTDIGAAETPVVVIGGGGISISSFGTNAGAGEQRIVVFGGVNTLVHGASSIILPSSTNINTASGDVAVFYFRSAAGGWRCVSYTRASGKALIGPAAADITDSTTAGRALVTAADAAAQRTALSLTGAATATYINPTSSNFTPTAAGSSTAGAGTYTTQTGRYQRVGNKVDFQVELTWTAHTGTGNLIVSGLPVTAAANSPVSILGLNIAGISNQVLKAMVVSGTTNVGIYVEGVNGSAALTAVALDTAATVYLQGSYFV